MKKRRRREATYIRDGRFGGYAQYRHGSPDDDRVYRPGQSRRRSRVFEGDRRRHMLDRIKALLSDWRSSRFEHEAAARSGLRAALCLGSFGWEVSDNEAASLISEAFAELSYRRPTWAQGQRDHVDTVEDCMSCGGALDAAQIGHGDRFCSPECAKAHLSARNDGWVRRSTLTNRAAQKLAAVAARALHKCERCGKTFRPRGHGNEAMYCSRKCANEAQRTIPERQCDNPECGKTFRPRMLRVRYCSVTCRAQHDAARERSTPKECTLCGAIFFSESPKSLFCSAQCRSAVYNYRKGVVPKRLAPPVFDFFVRIPAEAALVSVLLPERFDEMVALAA